MTWRQVALIPLSCAACDACRSGGGAPSAAPGVVLGELTVTSGSFSPNGPVPVDCTCDGADKSPELSWSAPPPGTKTFAIIADDPDAPGGVFTHWLAYNLPGDARALKEATDPVAAGGIAGTNDFERVGYGGPCPPRGQLHHYRFAVFALDASLGVRSGATREQLSLAMNGHVLAEGALTGIYSR